MSAERFVSIEVPPAPASGPAARPSRSSVFVSTRALTLGVALGATLALGCSANSDVPVAPSCTMPAHAFMADANDTPGFRRATLYWSAGGGCSLRPGAGEVIAAGAAGGVAAPSPGEPVAAFSIDDTGYAFFSADPWRYDAPIYDGSSNGLPEDILVQPAQTMSPLGVTLHSGGVNLGIKFHFSGELVYVDEIDAGGAP